MQRTNENPDDRAAEPSQTIADLQRELAQSRSERDEALAQQNATAEICRHHQYRRTNPESGASERAVGGDRTYGLFGASPFVAVKDAL